MNVQSLGATMSLSRACVVAILVAAVRPQALPTAQSSTTSVAAAVVVHLPAGRSTYRVGEEIPLDLEFRGTADKDYYFWTGTCGFFGHTLSDEKVAVTPSAGIEDA